MEEGENIMENKTSFRKAMFAIIWKDLISELRGKELISAMLVFALLVIFIFNFALELDPKTRSSLTAGILWVTIVFAGNLGLNRSMAVEKDRGCLDGLLLAPVDRTAVYFGKSIANWIFMLIVALIVLPVYSILYNTNIISPALLLIIFLGSEGYIAIGTLLATMSIQARTRDILLPILLFPVILPVLIASVKASAGILNGFPFADIQTWINLLIVYDIVFTSVAFMVFDAVVEE